MDDETRAYFDDFRGELVGLRGDFGEMRRDFAALDRKVDTTAEATRRHFDVVAEALRDDIRTVAEAVAANTEAVARLRSEVYREMETRFGVVNVAFAEVRRDIEDLRTRL